MKKLAAIFTICLIAGLATGSSLAHADGEDDGCSSSEGPKPGHCGNGYEGTPCENVPSTNPNYTPTDGWKHGNRAQFDACQDYLRHQQDYLHPR